MLGTGQSGANQFLFTFDSPGADVASERNLLVDTQGSTATAMALGSAGSKSFLGQSDAGVTSLALVDSSNVAGMTVVNTPNLISYVGDVANGDVLLATVPMNADPMSTDGGLSIFYGPPSDVAQRGITAFGESVSGDGSVTRRMIAGAQPFVLDGVVGAEDRRRAARVLDAYAATVPGFFLYFPSRAQSSPALRLFVDAASRSESAPSPMAAVCGFSAPPTPQRPISPSASVLPLCPRLVVLGMPPPVLPPWGRAPRDMPLRICRLRREHRRAWRSLLAHGLPARAAVHLRSGHDPPCSSLGPSLSFHSLPAWARTATSSSSGLRNRWPRDCTLIGPVAIRC